MVEAPYPSKAACTSMWSTSKVLEPLHMQWMGIWNHRQLVTIALVFPDFDSCRLKAWVTLLGYKPYHYAVVEAPYPSKAACTSMWSTYKVCEPLHKQWMGIWNHWQPITPTLVRNGDCHPPAWEVRPPNPNPCWTWGKGQRPHRLTEPRSQSKKNPP